MKKVVLGSAMLLAGLLSAAILLGGTMANDCTNNGMRSSIWNLSKYVLMPALCIFIGIAILGLVIAVWGIFEKND